MAHLDDGTLHAYLDGESGSAGEREEIEQHLAQCAECSAKLEEARGARTRATAILSGSGPRAVRAPSFEELERRARARQQKGRVWQLSRLKVLGLAASLVLAVAVGWVARGALLVERGGARFSADAPEATPYAAPDSAALARAQVAREDAVTGAGAGARASRPTLSRRDPQPAAEAPQQTHTPEADEVAREPTEAPPVAGVVPVEEARRETAPAAAEPRPAAREPAPALAEDVALELEDLRIAPTPVSGGWTPATEEAARAHFPGTVATLPELPVASYEIARVGGDRLVRIVQLAPTGEPLELVQHVAAAEDEALAGRARAVPLAEAKRQDLMEMYLDADSVGVVTVRQGNVLITLRGRLALDSLKALVERIREQ